MVVTRKRFFSAAVPEFDLLVATAALPK